MTMENCFVPSIGQMSYPFEPTNSLSIYDQEKFDINNISCGASSMSKVDKWDTDELCDLDDKIENSSLQSLLTPEIMSNLCAPSTTCSQAAPFPWNEKPTLDSTSVGSADVNITLNQLNMESFIDDILNCDTNDSKFSGIEFMCNDSRNTSSRNTPTCGTPNPINNDQIKSAPGLLKNSSTETVGIDFLKNLLPMKHFPPRENFPTQIGVVPPVKQQNNIVTLMAGIFPEPTKPTGAPVLHDLLSKSSNGNGKEVQELKCGSSSEAKLKSELQSQIVPSSGAMMKSWDIVKQEPTVLEIKSEPNSPESMMKHGYSEEFGASKLKRKRCDSGGSGDASYDDDDEEDDTNSPHDSSKHYEYDSEDDDSDIDADVRNMSTMGHESLIAIGKKQKQYFWQYNLQAKGPKGTRLKLSVESPSDPHVLNSIEDPVFDESSTTVAGIRHGGKARKGDGNEVAPNPYKLCKIGQQLMKLNEKINMCQLGTDVPAAKRNEARKEKNKLASRACRLKKKAQHEANKIKLYGLEDQHKQLNKTLGLIRPKIFQMAKDIQSTGNTMTVGTSLTDLMNTYIRDYFITDVAGNTTDYVNSVILKVEAGDNAGGLGIKRRKTNS